MTRVLLASNDSTQSQIESLFKPNGSFEVPIMASSSQNVEMAMQTLGQMISTSVPLPMPLPLSRPEQNSAITNHHQHQHNNTMTLTALTNGSMGHHQQQTQNLTPTSQSHSLELHSNFTNNTLEDTEVRPHMCQICQATYKTRTHLRRHMFIHLTSRPYPCPDCGKGFNRKEHLNKHCEAVHSGTKYKCPYCGKEISRKDHLSRHIKNMHLSTVGNTIQLRNIGDGEPLAHAFGNPKHPKSNSSSKQNVPRVFFPGGLTITSLNQPPVSKTQSNGSAASRYQDSAANVVSQHNFSHTNSAQQSTIGDKKLLLHLYTCPECSATFTSDRDLNIHSRIHKPQPYKCNECTRAYTRREKLTEHVRCFHQGQKFSCEYCGKELSRKDHVLRHVRSVHPEVLATRFVSIAEGGNFDGPNQIRSLGSTAPLHGNNSSNIPPSMGEMGLLLRSVCKICLKVFGTSYHLSRHMESCHNGDVRPYSCNNCSKQFKRKDHLTKHRKSHCPSSRDTAGNAVFRTAIRGAGASNPGGNSITNEAFVTSTLNAIDAADLMHQDAINSLQIEMMTDADEEDDDGESDTDTSSDDSNEGDETLPQNTSNGVIGGGNKKESQEVRKEVPTNPSENGFALSMLENEPNENAFIQIPMDTTDDNLEIQSAFPCGHCQKEFNSKTKLLHHLQEHSNNELKGVMAQDQGDSASKTVIDHKRTSPPAASEQMPVTSLWNS